MRTWYALFKDNPQYPEVVRERILGEAEFKLFDAAAKSNQIDGREIMGTWVIDYDTDQGYVIKLHGDHVPELERALYKVWKELKPIHFS